MIVKLRKLLPLVIFGLGVLLPFDLLPDIASVNSSLVLAQSPVINNVIAVDSVGMTVADMDKAIKFYAEALSFRKISDVEVWGSSYEYLQGLFGVRMRVVKMQLGTEILELTEYLTPKGRPIPSDSRSNDRWFQHIAIVVSDMDLAYAHLRKFKVEHASTAPQKLPESNQAAAGIRAFYFKDPDGHNLEIIYFPKGKGDRRWQNSRQLFLGIDHTAIVIKNTDLSLNFYRDLLGLKIAGKSENFGTEQEHLNNVFGAKLQITGLKARSGLGIEFLDYLSPSDGKPFPADARSNDLIHWQTTLVVKDLKSIVQKLRDRRVTFISPDLVDLPANSLGFRRGLLIRDPDGHAIRIVQNNGN
jgi:catechol 2,3-dioxygenase-like lactoylglutathione lyase family enzyme